MKAEEFLEQHTRHAIDLWPTEEVLKKEQVREYSSLQIKEAIEEIEKNSSPLLSKEYVLELLNSKINGK
jgi:hypothetical protein